MQERLNIQDLPELKIDPAAQDLMRRKRLPKMFLNAALSAVRGSASSGEVVGLKLVKVIEPADNSRSPFEEVVLEVLTQLAPIESLQLWHRIGEKMDEFKKNLSENSCIKFNRYFGFDILPKEFSELVSA